MDLALNNQQMLIGHKTQQTKPNQNIKSQYSKKINYPKIHLFQTTSLHNQGKDACDL